ncbi:MAG: transposase [Catonella sp.]|nr:MAG: transposase [Catonella sp.]
MKLNQQVRLYPNKTMKRVLDSLCDYRRYCWNKAIACWNEQYEARLIGLPQSVLDKLKCELELMPNEQVLVDRYPKPSYYSVRDELVSQKEDWQYTLSSRVLQLTVKDVASAWKLFFQNRETAGRPTFKTRKASKQGFKTDRSCIRDGYLLLDKPSGYQGRWYPIRFKGLSIPDGKLILCSVTRIGSRYTATFTIETPSIGSPHTGRKTAVDANVDHFDTTEGRTSLNPTVLNPLYNRVRHYQRSLARKRCVNPRAIHSKGYEATRTKLQRTYERIAHIQKDLLHKFTTHLYQQFDTVVIEDLDVKKMQMSKRAKNLHRSLFGQFRQMMEYKARKFGKTLVVADRFYPSTQRCSSCGFIKTGDDKITLNGNQKHGTRHNEYICYHCGYTDDRDRNAALNLLALVK